MKIHETNDYYVVTFFPDAEEVEIDDKTVEKGYKAIIGTQDGHHVVMKVMYDKSRYPLDKNDRIARGFPEDTETILDNYALRIGDCSICKQLDANVAKITEVRLLNQTQTNTVPVAPVGPVAQAVRVAPISATSLSTGNPFQDMMAQLMFDTKLNPTGQVIAAAALEDDALMAKSMPTTVEGMVDLVANLTDYASGKGTLFRSPSEVTDYVKALREGAKQPIDEKSTDKKEIPVFRRASTIIVS